MKMKYGSLKLLVVIFITEERNPFENKVKIKGSSVKEERERDKERLISTDVTCTTGFNHL